MPKEVGRRPLTVETGVRFQVNGQNDSGTGLSPSTIERHLSGRWLSGSAWPYG